MPAGSLYAVGGRVRDEVRSAIEGLPPDGKDLDYVVTGLSAEELRGRLERLGRVDLVGASFAIFKVSLDDCVVDVALPRREASTGSGHRDFRIESGPHVTLTEDLARRDFRINMLARSIPSGTLVDPYGGESDIRARRIDILAPRVFEEDPLRMLRAAQFAARFGYAASDATRSAMAAAATTVSTVSPERISDELTKLLARAPKPSVGFELLRETGVLQHLWAELLEGVGVEQNEWHAYDVYRHALATLDAVPAGDVALRLAALLHDVGKPRTKSGPHFYRHEQVGADMAVEMLQRTRFSNEMVQTVERLVRQHMYLADPALSDAAIRRFIRRIGVANVQRQFALRMADIAGSGLPKRDDSNERFAARVYAELERRPPFSVTDLAISGDDVIAVMIERGLAPKTFGGDQRVGKALDALFEQVTEQPERNERSTLKALLEQYLESGGG